MSSKVLHFILTTVFIGMLLVAFFALPASGQAIISLCLTGGVAGHFASKLADRVIKNLKSGD